MFKKISKIQYCYLWNTGLVTGFESPYPPPPKKDLEGVRQACFT